MQYQDEHRTYRQVEIALFAIVLALICIFGVELKAFAADETYESEIIQLENGSAEETTEEILEPKTEEEAETETEVETESVSVPHGLIKENGVIHFYEEDGSLFKKGLKEISSEGKTKYYFFQEDGSAFTDGFKTVINGSDRKYYFFQEDGSAFTSGYKEYEISGKKYFSFFNSDGTAFTDGYKDITLDGKSYGFYFLANGLGFSSGYKTVKIDGKTYYFYFGSNGRAVTDTVQKVGFGEKVTYYYFQSNGRAFTEGYKEVKNGSKNSYYYFLANGRAFDNGYKTAKIDGTTYYFYFNNDGTAFTGGIKEVKFASVVQYYFFQDNGRAFTDGLKDVSGTKYYFESNGRALKDIYKTIDGTMYYFEKDGKAYNKKIYTIVLDPGHDGKHTGAVFNDVHEEVCNMKIAEAMKAELEKYKGVVVYMTHDTLECDYPDDDTDYGWEEKSELAYRVEKAENLGADYLISLHNDITANSWTSSRGLLMLYPNANYRKNCQTEAIDMGKCIVEAMDKIGITYRGNYIFDIDDGRTYPDGSTADYYGILRNAKLRSIPAIIIEHAILNNREDNAMLQSDESLKKLGIADAAGVVSYLGLEKR